MRFLGSLIRVSENRPKIPHLITCTLYSHVGLRKWQLFINSGTVLATTEVLKGNLWTKSIKLPKPLARHCMLSLNRTHHILLGGSESVAVKSLGTKDTFSSSTYIYSNNKFKEVASMATARRSHGCAVVDENVFIAGGFNGDRLSSVEYFSLTSLTWHTGPSLPFSTTYARLIQIRGDLYFLGGYIDRRKTKAIYYLETSSGKRVSNLRWKHVGNLKNPKMLFAALPLPWVKTVCNWFTFVNKNICLQCAKSFW